MRRFLAVIGVLALSGCTTGGLIPADADLPEAGPPLDAGQDAGRRDAGPRPDAGPRFDDVLIYAHSRDTLFGFSPYTNQVTAVGTFRTPTGENAPFMLDLAVDSEGVIFTSSDRALFTVDPTTAVVTEVGDFGLPERELLFALSFLAPAESPDGTEMLVGATNEGVYYRVERATARTTRLGAYPDGWSSSGDIVSVEGLGTFATLRRSDFPGDVLARILFAGDGSSVVTVIGPIRGGTTDYTQIFGLGYWGRSLYGFTNGGQLLRIDRATGAAEVATPDTGASQFWGAGVTVLAFVLG